MYAQGKVLVAFRPEATTQEVSEVLGLHPYGFLKLVIDEPVGADRDAQVLARTYILNVPPNEEDALIAELKAGHGRALVAASRILRSLNTKS